MPDFQNHRTRSTCFCNAIHIIARLGSQIIKMEIICVHFIVVIVLSDRLHSHVSHVSRWIFLNTGHTCYPLDHEVE